MSKRTKTERKRQRSAQQAQSKWTYALAIGGPRREPNGRLSRRVIEATEREHRNQHDAKRTMIEARMRHTGLDEKTVDVVDAGSPNVGTVHGRWQIEGRITLDQFATCQWYIEKQAAWARAMEVPGQPIIHKEDRFDPDAHKEFCKKAREQWTEIVDCLQRASTENRAPIIAAMDCILIRQSELDHLAGELRLGANALRKAFL